jgi:hypothetical protein
VNALGLFLILWNHLAHESCVVLVGHSPGPMRAPFGGNCVDALSYVAHFGGFISWGA